MVGCKGGDGRLWRRGTALCCGVLLALLAPSAVAGAGAPSTPGPTDGGPTAGAGSSGSSSGPSSAPSGPSAGPGASAGPGTPVAPPATLPDDCSVDVSAAMQHWLHKLPAGSTVVPPPGACYLVDEGLQLWNAQGLTIDGGTWRDDADLSGPDVTEPDDAVFWFVGGSDITLEDLTVQGANPGGYHVTGAFAAGVRSDGVIGLTVSSVDIDDVYGDGIWLNVERAVDDNGPTIVNPTEQATITDVDIDGAGRQGIAFVGVTGAQVASVQVADIGFDTFDFEADQTNEGARDVTIDGCTSGPSVGPFLANIGNGDGGHWTSDIVVENCTMPAMQAGTVVQIATPAGQKPRGPYVFSDDHFECGATTLVACLELTGVDAEFTGCTFHMPATGQHQWLYTVSGDSTVSLTDDRMANYSALGSVDATSTVTLTSDALFPYTPPAPAGPAPSTSGPSAPGPGPSAAPAVSTGPGGGPPRAGGRSGARRRARPAGPPVSGPGMSNPGTSAAGTSAPGTSGAGSSGPGGPGTSGSGTSGPRPRRSTDRVVPPRPRHRGGVAGPHLQRALARMHSTTRT